MKQHIATTAILAMIAASAFADFDSDVYFLTNGVLGLLRWPDRRKSGKL